MKALYSILLLGLTACASDPAQQSANAKPTQEDPENGVICTYSVPTGSSLREKKCTTPQQREDARRQSEHQMVVQPMPGNAR